VIDLEKNINEKMKQCWEPANIAVVDETLVHIKDNKICTMSSLFKSLILMA